jgi:hypothetical protein
MSKHSLISPADMHELLMGLSRLTGSPLVADIAKVVGDLAPAGLNNAFNPKQIASKVWLIDQLHAHAGGVHGKVTVMGGWFGALSAMLLNDARFTLGSVDSIDIDPTCAPVAEMLNRRFVAEGRFRAVTRDMHSTGGAISAHGPGSLVINTSCEHIPDVAQWLATLPRDQLVVLQSNNYRSVPEHISCVDSAEEFAEKAALSQILFSGALPSRRYTRFMLIGRT